MNEHFVNVKVDREERPDVDAVYMDAVVSADRAGRLADDGVPHARRRAVLRRHVLPAGAAARAAVVPPAARRGRRGVPRPPRRRRAAGRGARRGAAAQRARRRRRASRSPTSSSREAERVLRAQYDPHWGGFGRAPKFPPASTIEFLLRRGVFDLALGTLDGMRAGGMYDLVGGGFHRYSVDAQWLVPHFEKMLYDNALLVPAYLHAWVLTGEDELSQRRRGDGRVRAPRAAPRGRRLRVRTGRRHRRRRGPDVHVDAEELEAAIGPGREELLQPFEHGRSILRGRLDRARSGRRSSRVREQRPKPLRDDKAIAALERADARRARRGRPPARARRLARRRARARRVPARPALRRRAPAPHVARTASRRARATSRTTRTSRTASTSCTSRPASCAGCTSRTGSRCSRSSCSATTSSAASSSRRPTASSSSRARRISTTTRRRRATRCSRSCCCGSRASGATTSSSGARVGVLRLVRDVIPRAPSAFGWALCALDLHLSPPRELAIVGGPDSDGRARRPARPRRRTRSSPSARRTTCRCSPARTSSTARPAVYVCERFACRAPVTDAALL